jgi:DNA-binding transcriptional regulator LsrR (DeoR family)
MAKRGKNPVEESRSPTRLPARKVGLQMLQAKGVDLDAITSLVCNNLNLPAQQILELIKKEFGVPMGREQPYEILRRAAASQRLHYIAPLDSDLAVKLHEGHKWLLRARVVRTASQTDVARQAALLLVELAEKWDKRDLHIGIAGGEVMAETVRVWAGFLREAHNVKFRRLFVHALVAATYDPRRSPNGFAQWLIDDALPFETEFVGLPIPAFVRAPALETLRKMDGVRQAFERAAELDIVITSAGAHWKKGCSGLNRSYKEEDANAVRTLEDAGCIGDVIWQPFGRHGPVTVDVGLRAGTLINLSHLPELVSKGKRVVLVLAPCGARSCGEPKDEILRAVLGWRNGITDLVVDARTARLALGDDPQTMTAGEDH